MCDQLPVPGKNGVGCDDRGDFCYSDPTKEPRFSDLDVERKITGKVNMFGSFTMRSQKPESLLALL
jgi:hypothetical protein